MHGTTRKSKILIVVLFLIVVAILAVSFSFNEPNIIKAGELKEGYDYGTFTFKREMTLLDGTLAEYYESGDECFSYAHDAEGYLLLEGEGTLEYAVSNAGVPTPSGVSYGASRKELGSIVRMLASDVDYSLEEVVTNAEGLDGMSVIETSPVLAAASGTTQNIANLTVFIAFKDDNFTPSNELLNIFNGTSTSLKSYYSVMSNGAVNIHSLIPYNGSQVYVYNDDNNRSYYNTSGNDRWRKESTLVSNAIKSATNYYNISQGTDLDVNDDQYIDSVSIIVYGSSSSTWGSLLWPHSVNLDSIDGDNNYTPVNGVKVGNYSFNFERNITLGVLCHETAHVLGAPDLYHYNGSSSQNQDIVTVGKWDLMENDLDMPQYLLTYMRKNYVGGIGDEQIESITENGVYSLKPVSSASSNDVLAYKIPTSKDEYFMVEYRRKTNSGYDSELPGSGLIVYRVKEPKDFATSKGNINAVYQGIGDKADEVFVFRPSIKMTGDEFLTADRYANSVYDIDRAYLSPSNPYYTKIGKEVASKSYDLETIYYSDGSNSDVIIEALSISADSIQFSVRLGQDMVDDEYFDGKISITEADYVNATYAGVKASVEFEEINTQYLSSLTLELRDASGNAVVKNDLNQGRFLNDYSLGLRKLTADFIYADKGNTIDTTAFNRGIFITENAPVKAVLIVTDADGDSSVIDEFTIKDSLKIGWETIKNAKTELSASIVASSKMTVGVRRDGTVDASGTLTSGQWAVEGYEGVVDVALGYTHTLMLTSNLNVLAIGTDNYDETLVAGWYDVKEIAAGTYASYGLKTDGTVLATGLNDKGQLNVSSWTGIMNISAISKRVAGVTMAGKVVASGNFSEAELEEISTLSGVKEVVLGLNFTAVLKNDGTVQVVGNLPSGDVSSFKKVVKISAGTHHILAITEGGEVLSAGDNSYGQSDVHALYDIIDVAAGEYHSAFLREDGVVEFRGAGSDKYGTNVGIGNLLYDDYVAVEEINGITGVSNGTIRIAKGTSRELIVETLPTTATYARIVFEVQNGSVVTLTANGYYTATLYADEVGTSTVTARVNGSNVSSTFTVVVYENVPLTGIEFREDERSLLSGTTSILSLFAIPEQANYTGVPMFTTSNEEVVSVDANGRVTALGLPGESATITASLAGFTASIVVRIVGDVDSIAVDLNGGSTVYRYGEDLDLSRYILKVTVGGTVEDAIMSSDMVSGYDKEDKTSLKQTLTVSHMGRTTTFEVSVKDYVVRIKQTEAPRSKYRYNENLDSVSGRYDVYYASGDNRIGNSFTASNYVGYDKTLIGRQQITYVHEDTAWGTRFTLVHEVNVVDYVESIKFEPYKINYLYAESLDLDEFVDLNMASGSIRQTELRECTVKDEHTLETDATSPLYSLYSLRVGDHRLKVSYHDQETGATHSVTAIVNVDVVGEYRTSGLDAETLYYYYEVGGSLYVGLILVQEGVEDVTISENENKDIWFKLFTMGDEKVPFDNSIVGAQHGIIEIHVNRQYLNGEDVIVEDVEVWSLSIDAYGLAQAKSVAIKSSSKTEYVYGDVINGDEDNLDVTLTLTMEDGSTKDVAPMELSYDGEVIGVQTLKARYLDTWLSLEITIADYVVDFNAIEDVELLWGTEISFDVYAVYARAGSVLITEGFSTSSYSNLVVGTQRVTVTLNSNPQIKTTFNIVVTDAFKDIRIDQTPKTKYAKGERFDPTSTYIVTMISGETYGVNYDLANFYYTPEFNSDEVAQGQTISIYYTGEGVTVPKLVWSGSCMVPNYVTKLEVVGANSKNEYKYGEELSISVKASYADGASTTLTTKSYSTNFNNKLVGTQTITVNYVYSGVSYTTTYTVSVVDTAKTLSIEIEPEKQYGYGDVINWVGAKVVVDFSSAGKVTYVGNEIKSLNVSYTTLTSGLQRVTVSMGTASDFFTITVGKDTNAAVENAVEGVKVDVAKRTISLTEPRTLAEVLSSLSVAGYLNGKYVSLLKGEVDLSSSTVSTQKAGSGDKLIYLNGEGKTVFEFTVYLRGDANGDGEVNALDVQGMAGMLAVGNTTQAIIDVNGDGKLNLTDLVTLARKTGGGAPKNVPVSDAAKEFVAPIRLKGKEEEKDA